MKYTFLPGFPRPPQDEIERQALVSGAPYCRTVSTRGWTCCRTLDHEDDHVAAGLKEIFDRWPQSVEKKP